MNKVVLLSILMSFSFGSFAATEIHDSEMASMKARLAMFLLK